MGLTPVAAPEPHDANEAEFWRRYGPWQPFTMAQVQGIFGDWDRPWWVAGGWALDAATGTTRHHDDVDVAFFVEDLPRLRHLLEPRFHLWSVGSHLMRAITDEQPDLHEMSRQVWIREHAYAPWRADLLATAGSANRFTVHFDPTFGATLDEASWVAPDGIRYLAPDLVLAFKARARRSKDEIDLERTLPVLTPTQLTRLTDLVVRLDPEHPWLTRIR